MNLAKKLSKLKKVSELKPDRKWEKTTKYELLSEISSQNRLMKSQELSSAEKVDLFMSRVLRRTMPSMNKVIAGFLVIMMGSGVAFAAQASVPGEPLWPIKRSIEKAEITLTLSPVRETEVHIKHITKRLDEIDKILNELDTQPEKTAKKEKAIKTAVTHLQKDITSADTSLKIVKEEKKPLETVTLAKKVSDATKETKASLKEKAVKSSDQIITKALDDIEVVNEEAKKSAVTLALEVHEEISLVNDTNKNAEETTSEPTTTLSMLNKTSDEEVEAVKAVVTEMIASEIDDASSDIQSTKEKVGVIDNERLQNLSNTDEDLVNQDLDSVKENPAVAEGVLGEAKALLEGGSLKDALDKVSESKEINKKTEAVLEKISTVGQYQAEESEAETTTNNDTHNTSSADNIKEGEVIKASTVDVDKEDSVDTEITKPEEIVIE